MIQHRIIIGSVPRLMRVDNEKDEEEDVDVEIVSTSQYAGVRTRKGKVLARVLVWSALGLLWAPRQRPTGRPNPI